MRIAERGAVNISHWICAFVIGAVALSGCGGTDRPKTIPISGRVTFDGREPGEGGKLHFTPVEVAEGYSKRPASGVFDPQGNYRVMSWEPDDGLVPGRYTVTLMPSDMSATKIPAKYQESTTSGLEVDVPVDKDEVQFDVNVVTK